LTTPFVDPEDGGSMGLWNICILPQQHTVSQPKNTSTWTIQWSACLLKSQAIKSNKSNLVVKMLCKWMGTANSLLLKSLDKLSSLVSIPHAIQFTS